MSLFKYLLLTSSSFLIACGGQNTGDIDNSGNDGAGGSGVTTERDERGRPDGFVSGGCEMAEGGALKPYWHGHAERIETTCPDDLFPSTEFRLWLYTFTLGGAVSISYETYDKTEYLCTGMQEDCNVSINCDNDPEAVESVDLDLGVSGDDVFGLMTIKDPVRTCEATFQLEMTAYTQEDYERDVLGEGT